jgi:hypothetical protein
VPSFAVTLVNQGVPAVLGWGRPVLDDTGIIAAKELYSQLASGRSITQAVSQTFQKMLEEHAPDWHLLRLYARAGACTALVNPPGDYVPVKRQTDDAFLDAEKNVRVATADKFVGRRRILQRCLRALREAKNLGVILYGMGGNGKSSIASRLLERLNGYVPIVIYRDLDEQKLVKMLIIQSTSEAGYGMLKGSLPLENKLTKFLRDGLDKPDLRFCFVLDDFEANLEVLVDGRQGIKGEVVPVITALLNAMRACGVAHRMVVTSCYDFKLPTENAALHREALPTLQGTDLTKKYERLDALSSRSSIEPELKELGRKLADGNPRLLEWLDKIVIDQDLDRDQVIERMAEKESEFREVIMVEAVLGQQEPDLKRFLARMQIFNLPVPPEAMQAVCADIPNWQRHRDRAVALGLLEVS